jgi:hypothetical protein
MRKLSHEVPMFHARSELERVQTIVSTHSICCRELQIASHVQLLSRMHLRWCFLVGTPAHPPFCSLISGQAQRLRPFHAPPTDHLSLAQSSAVPVAALRPLHEARYLVTRRKRCPASVTPCKRIKPHGRAPLARPRSRPQTPPAGRLKSGLQRNVRPRRRAPSCTRPSVI